MVGILIAIHTIICILLVGVILMQASQGGGLAGTVGGGMTNAVFGGRGTATILSKATIYLATGFIVLALLIGLIGSPQNTQPESLLKQQADEQLLDLSLPATQDLETTE